MHVKRVQELVEQRLEAELETARQHAREAKAKADTAEMEAKQMEFIADYIRRNAETMLLPRLRKMVGDA